MKFTDKFVLVPIERYERLTKMQSSSNKETNSKKEDNIHFERKDLSIEDRKDISEEEIKSQEDSIVKKENHFDQENSTPLVNPQKKKKQVIKNKLPAPPPGIPVSIKKRKTKKLSTPPGINNKKKIKKIKKEDFRWYNIFKK